MLNPTCRRSAGAVLAAGLTLLMPGLAQAWWNADYTQRTQITLNTSAAGVETKEAVSALAVPVRLHTGNFDFLGAKPDGADLRFVAADDKTPLKFTVEKFDGTAEMAVVWVQVPTLAPGSDKNIFYAYAGNEKAAAEPAAAVFDSATLAAFHFGEADGIAKDHNGGTPSQGPAVPEAAGLIGTGIKLDAGSTLAWAASDKLRAAAGAPYTVSLWVKPATATGTVYAQGGFSIVLQAGKAALKLGTVEAAGGDLPVGAWAQLAVTLGGGKARLFVNGEQAAEAALPNPAPAVEGGITLGGNGFAGAMDELQIANVQRSADWLRLNRAAQGSDAKLVASVKETEADAEASSGDAGYWGILFANLTHDAIIVMVFLGIMFIVACWVMVAKARLVLRTDSANQSFIQAFRAADDVLAASKADAHPNSSLARLYHTGVAQLRKRDVHQGALSDASLSAVRAAVDADLVRENHKLNSLMVLLTIAISGGPFIGLLGTVFGVMITFAAIAAAGDVNVNAIAPGIAAALLATVAGLAVAIPALFGYNYLASRIKQISSDMQIFVDEFVTRVAEKHGA